MITLLDSYQQKSAIQHLNLVIASFLAQEKHLYAVLEPTQHNEIQEAFLTSFVDYVEPFLSFEPRLEDVGPRIVQLGKNKDFDNWIIEKALFNRWTALFVSGYDIYRISQQLSYLCHSVTFEHDPVIFRCYTPTVLHEWLYALEQDNELIKALGICPEILYIGDFPEQLMYCRIRDNITCERKIIDLIGNKETIPIEPVNAFQVEDIETHWFISQVQSMCLHKARVSYMTHSIRNELFLHQALITKRNIAAIHQQIWNLVEICINKNISDNYLIKEFITLYFDYSSIWAQYSQHIMTLLTSERNNADKIEQIASFLENPC